MKIEVLEPTALESVTRAETDIRVATAKRYPRDILQARQNAISLATSDMETAEECHFSLPRAGKNIEGPSVRFAEIIRLTWGNLYVVTRVMGIDEHHVTCAAVCQDLEHNVTEACEVKRRITHKSGQRFNDDMITVTANAGMAVAKRNAIISIIPKALWRPIYDAALKIAYDGKTPIGQRRIAAMQWFDARGVSQDKILKKLGISKVGEIGQDQIKVLHGLANSIKEEQVTIEEAFSEKDEQKKETPDDPFATPPESFKEPKAEETKEETKEETPPVNTPEREWLWNEWKKIRPKLSQDDFNIVRAAAAVKEIKPSCNEHEMRSVLSKAEELLLGKQK